MFTNALATLMVLVLVALGFTLALEPGPVLSRLRQLAVGEAGLLFQRISRTSPEKIFVVVKNNFSTAAITIGQVVQWDFTAADGVSVTRPTARATNGGVATCGVVADQSIASAGFGLVQVFGLHSSVRMRVVTGGAPNIAPGRPLAVNSAGSVFCAESMSTAAAAIKIFPFAFSLATTTGFTTNARAAFIKAM